MAFRVNAQQLMANANDRIKNLFGGMVGYQDSKHTSFSCSFGYAVNPEFDKFYNMYDRDSVSAGVVEKPIVKCWQDNPTLEYGDNGQPKDVAEHLKSIRFWAKIKQADLQSRVGQYSAVILRLADSKRLNEPVDTVPGGIKGLVDVIPAWECQLTASDWEYDEMSPDYGKPKMYQFDEQAVDSQPGKTRSSQIHPDRVIIWSRDGTIYGRSVLKSILDDLEDHKKMAGSGAEGNYQASKGTANFIVDKDANINQIATDSGLDSPVDLGEHLGAMVDDERKGFDTSLVVQAMDISYKQISLNDPKGFADMTEKRIAAGSNISLKALFGNQNGERASTEDNKADNAAAQSRRTGYIMPNLESMFGRLERYNVIASGWKIEWSDLTEASKEQKLANGKTMSEINRNTMGTGEPAPFSSEQIAESSGFEMDAE